MPYILHVYYEIYFYFVFPNFKKFPKFLKIISMGFVKKNTISINDEIVNKFINVQLPLINVISNTRFNFYLVYNVFLKC
jgi:hypothetical protein